MKKIFKRFSVLLLSIVLLLPLFLFVGCDRRPLPDDGSMQNAVAESQYGFVNKIGNYIYFINGAEDYQANNDYGKVVKGALMRLHVNNLSSGNGAEMVVPELVVSADYKSGIVIHNGYVYYASPNRTKNLKGQVEKDYLDFKSAKLDGTNVRNLARALNNNTQYRFSIVNGKVYLVYLNNPNDNTKEIYSVDTSSGANTLLVRGYDTAILAEDNNVHAKYVYYTMQVVSPTANSSQKTYDRNKDDYKAPTTYESRQLYRVDISGGGVDTSREKNITTETIRNAGYVAQDGTVLDYCNHGELLYDGLSSQDPLTIFNAENMQNRGIRSVSFVLSRYMSTQNYQEGKSDASAGGSLFIELLVLGDTENANNRGIYIFNEELFDANKASHNYVPPYTLADNTNVTLTVDFNQVLAPVFLKNGSTSIIEGAILLPQENQQGLIYIQRSGVLNSDSNSSSSSVAIELRQIAQGNTVTTTTGNASVLTREGVTSDTELLYVQGDQLYYNATGNSGKKLYKVEYQQSGQLVTTEQKGIRFLEIEYKGDWYKPELLTVDGVEYLFFANASTYGENYVNILQTTDLATKNTEWEKIQKAFESIEENNALIQYRTTTLNLCKFYFYTGLELSPNNNTKFADNTIRAYYEKLVEDETEQAVSWTNLFITGGHQGSMNFTDLPKNDANKVKTESDFYKMIGERADGGISRQRDIATALLPSIPSTAWTWQWWALFVPLGVALLAGAGVTTWLILRSKKKKKDNAKKLLQVAKIVEKK